MNYVIFSSVYTLVCMGVIAALYTAIFFARAARAKRLLAVFVFVSLAAHIALMVFCIYLQATVAEYMFLTVASTLLSLISTARKGEDEK